MTHGNYLSYLYSLQLWFIFRVLYVRMHMHIQHIHIHLYTSVCIHIWEPRNETTIEIGGVHVGVVFVLDPGLATAGSKACLV